jgi:hypothetical protein
MTLSDHKGKQMFMDTLQKSFLTDFRTVFEPTCCFSHHAHENVVFYFAADFDKMCVALATTSLQQT